MKPFVCRTPGQSRVARGLTGLALTLWLAVPVQGQSQGGCLFPENCLIPANARYVGPFLSWGGGLVVLLSPTLDQFKNLDQFSDCVSPPEDGQPALRKLGAWLNGFLIVENVPLGMVSGPADITLRVTPLDQGEKVGGSAIYKVDIVEFRCSLLIPSAPDPDPGQTVEISEPSFEGVSQSSGGFTHIQRLPSGAFRTHSSLRLFTEASGDGGANWVLSDPPPPLGLECPLGPN